MNLDASVSRVLGHCKTAAWSSLCVDRSNWHAHRDDLSKGIPHPHQPVLEALGLWKHSALHSVVL